MGVGTLAFAYGRFAILYPADSRVVQALGESPLTRPEHDGGFIRYEVEWGPPVRVVFPHFGGVTDNWVGTVYDPSDEVAKAEGWDYTNETPAFTAPDGIRELFGGDIVSCRRLYGHYFMCVFT